MRVQLPYDWLPPFTVPDANLVGVFAPAAVAATGDETALIQTGLAGPIGARRLRDEAGNAHRILILADDVSRPTPVARFLPAVLAELHAAGKRDDQITFLMSLGTHRPMTAAEIDRKLGPGIRARFTVRNHQWDDPAQLVNLGVTSSGNDILVNRLVTEADFVIGLGNIVPHPAAGFAGGGKIVDPGCVSDETCGAFHWESVHYPAQQVVGVPDNPMLRMIDEVAARAGLRYIVNTILDAHNRIVRVVAGHPVAAHRDGCRTAIEVYGVRIPRRADLVICDSHPADLEMWQAIKGLCTADLCLADGGIVIMATPCPEGASAEHPELERYGYRNLAATTELLRAGKVSKVVGHHLVQAGRLRDRAQRVVLVSNHLSREVVERLHFTWAATMDAAIADALRDLGPHASIVVLHNAAELFPVITA